MAALTQDVSVRLSEGIEMSYPAAVDICYEGSLISEDASGNGAPNTASAGVFLGICIAQVDNSAGSAGDKDVKVYKAQSLYATLASLSATDIGRPVYCSTDNINDAVVGGDTGTYIGKVEKVVSASAGTCYIKTEVVETTDEVLDDISVNKISDLQGNLAIELTSNKIGLYSTTPVIQDSAITDYTITHTSAAITLSTLGDATSGTNIASLQPVPAAHDSFALLNNNFKAIVDRITEIKADLDNIHTQFSSVNTDLDGTVAQAIRNTTAHERIGIVAT